MDRSTLLHLRFPFSLFLLPVFLFALSISGQADHLNIYITAGILHLLLYPASNGYNSYFDKDEGSIGGLKKPPPVTKNLYYTSILLDTAAIVLSLIFLNFAFTVMVVIFGFASKAYSHPSIRLKKYPLLGWLTIFFFQGYLIFIASYIAINNVNLTDTFNQAVQLPAVLSSLLLGGSYPMTQIYQHDEDRKRGDITLSIQLGVIGTFHFTALLFFISNIGFAYFFINYFSLWIFCVFLICLGPVLVYFMRWYFKVRKNLSLANFESTMRLNALSSLMLNLFFLGLVFFS